MRADTNHLTLHGTFVRLEPLGPRHAADLFAAGRDESIWTYMPRGPFDSLDDVQGWIAAAEQFRQSGAQEPFAIMDLRSERAVGSTRFLDVRPDDRGLEIGYTWLTPAAQRTAINTECKLLLLAHAFDVRRCFRVQLKTDRRNIRSQKAIERLGAVREGTLRQHMVVRDGALRDTVVYSIIDTEWPAIRDRLRERLARSPGR
ncbi:MAG: GNAT family N-acetyltransferase [Phycisphaerae bacterium]|nr:GNAT family N-acetyltransferase [Phycisphaerae bacterium]